MNFKNHLFFSFFFVFFFIKIFNIFIYIDLWHVIFFSLISCLLPDIDHKRSFLNCNFFFLSWLNFFSHRKFTHSFLSLIIFSFFLFYCNFKKLNINLDIIIGSIIGYLSHIIADIFSFKGIYFFWPFYIKVKFPLWFLFYNKIIKYFLYILFLLLFLFC